MSNTMTVEQKGAAEATLRNSGEEKDGLAVLLSLFREVTSAPA